MRHIAVGLIAFSWLPFCGCQPTSAPDSNATSAATADESAALTEDNDVVDEAIETADNVASETQEALSEAADAAEQTIEEVRENVSQAVDQTAAAAQDAVTEAVVEETVEEVITEETGSDDTQASEATAVELTPVSVVLGSDELTSGIPGSGDLTLDQIRAWLDNPENHRVIQPELPLGLDAAAANITGIDENPMTRAKIELGRQLYFDPRLSSDGTISCASCHHPDEGYGRNTTFGVGVNGQEGNRNSPISYNRIVSGPQFWDGRAASLEEQAAGPIANPIEMANTHDKALETIRGIEGYQLQFAKIFPDEGINIDTVTQAIATFERALVTAPAPYDYYEKVLSIERAFGDELEDLEEIDPEIYEQYQVALEGSKPMSDSAKRGRDLFFSDRVGCTACHAGANFSDEKYHNLGVGMDAEDPDLGRFAVTGKEEDKGAFKTPTCRNVIFSAPYMHDGSQATLEEVVDWYDKGGHPNPYLSDKVKKLNLTEQEKKDLVAFMKEGLTSSFPKVEQNRLP